MNWNGTIQMRPFNLSSEAELATLRSFLARFSLGFEPGSELSIGLYDHDRLVACGSLRGRLLVGLAVLPEYQGEGLLTELIRHLTAEAGERGHYHILVVTTHTAAVQIEQVGFTSLVSTDDAVLLETGAPTFGHYIGQCQRRAQRVAGGGLAGPISSIVANANPFTRGHRYLVEEASRQSALLHLFIVSEDLSLFPSQVRLKMALENVSDLSNVVVHPTGDYMVSAATFPSYFLRDPHHVAKAQMAMDLKLFATRVAPALGITTRWVGDEPLCPVTRAYNQDMQAILPKHGITVRELPRLAKGDAVISASRVRELIRLKQLSLLAGLLPEPSYRFLVSAEAEPILKRIQSSSDPH